MKTPSAFLAVIPLRDGEPRAHATTPDSMEMLAGAALRDVMRERIEQIDKHGFTLEHDMAHAASDLPLAALAYLETALSGLMGRPASEITETPTAWPFRDLFNPSHPRANLIKAAAFLLAAIDRLDHSPADASPSPVRGEGRGEGARP